MGAIPIRNVWCMNKNRKQGTQRYSKQVSLKRMIYILRKDGRKGKKIPIFNQESEPECLKSNENTHLDIPGMKQ